MFTGLIECVGRMVRQQRSGASVRLEVSAPIAASEVAIGDSIAVNGACLTVTAISGDRFSFDVSPETIARTTFLGMSPGTPVNMERALRFGGRLDGHLVTGHIDCIGRLERSEARGNTRFLTLSLPSEHAGMLVEKGSVAVDGVSLTVNAVKDDSFELAIIPHTLEKTTLATLSPGQQVNLETDIIGKYVARLVSPHSKGAGLTMETLMKNGFI